MKQKIRAILNKLPLKSLEFNPLISLILLGYFLIELSYIHSLPLIMDEFQGSQHVNEMGQGIPYVDFRPYKNVIGYYIQYIGMSLPGTFWQKLMYVKYEMLLINCVGLFLFTRALRKYFQSGPILFGLLFAICMSNFLERSTVLRVDMLTVWAGAFSFLMLLNQRFATAGALAALSFLISQKGAYFAIASGCSLSIHWLLCERTAARFKRLLRFAIAALLPLLLYYIIFLLLGGGLGQVAKHISVADKAIVFDNLYPDIRKYWSQTISRNTFLYFLSYHGLLASLVILFREKLRTERTVITATYMVTFLLLLVWHKQPWPYFFVFLTPAIIFILSQGLDLCKQLTPKFYLIIATLGIIFCVISPLYNRAPKVYDRDQGRQKNVIDLAYAILEPGDHYFSGIRMLNGFDQPRKLRWLDRKRLMTYRKASRAEFKPVMDQFMNHFPKILITNYRLKKKNLRRDLRQILNNNFAHLHNNIHTYCPKIRPNKSILNLRFSGRYQARYLKNRKKKSYTLNGTRYKAYKYISLEAGTYSVHAQTQFRLCLVPEKVKEFLDPKFKKEGKLFHKAYDY